MITMYVVCTFREIDFHRTQKILSTCCHRMNLYVRGGGIIIFAVVEFAFFLNIWHYDILRNTIIWILLLLYVNILLFE